MWAIGAAAAIAVLLVPGATAAAASVELGAGTSITATFDHVNIPYGEVVWFSAVVQHRGNYYNDHLHFINQTITFVEPNGTTFSVKVPDGIVYFSETANTTSTVYYASNYTWYTTVPANYSGEIFLSGLAFYVRAGGLTGGTQVTWAGDFLVSEPCMDYQWKFTAAVYTEFSHNFSALGVTSIDSTHGWSHSSTSDHAGTPENYSTDLSQGAMSTQTSNRCGSTSTSYYWSCTARVYKCESSSGSCGGYS